jgi:hypothetical protein
MGNTSAEWKSFIDNKSPVIIFKQQELGYITYAVVVDEDPTDVWLDALKSLSMAQQFCKKHKLPVKRIIK